MVSSRRETDALCGDTHNELGRDGATGTSWKTRVVGLTIGAMVAVGFIMAVLGTQTINPVVINLAASRAQLRAHDLNEGAAVAMHAFEGPPRAWKVGSDPQPGASPGTANEPADGGSESLRHLLRGYFGLDNDANKPRASSPASLPLPNPAEPPRAPAENEGKNSLKAMLLAHFGLKDDDTDVDPSEGAPTDTKAGTGLHFDDETIAKLKHELRDQLRRIFALENQHTEPPASMTKTDFKAAIAQQFEPIESVLTEGTLRAQMARAHAETTRQAIFSCIDQAVETAVDKGTGHVHVSEMNTAIDWLVNHCISLP